ncbi:MAG: hypothetical protein WCA85_17760 [Paraburkholderia sp.]|uniref:hypothetical protein n=1 Tax=Paraburkholderia sp. TaxID=1926495 RepID=UPI003C3958F2
MKTRILRVLLAVASTAVVVPAFASGYGPAPFLNPTVGAPASQQGQNEQTLAADRMNEGDNSSYGGVSGAASQSGSYSAANPTAMHSDAGEPLTTRMKSVDSGH